MRGFKNDDEKYLGSMTGHPNDFSVNVDEPQTVSNDPMVHSAVQSVTA